MPDFPFKTKAKCHMLVFQSLCSYEIPYCVVIKKTNIQKLCVYNQDLFSEITIHAIIGRLHQLQFLSSKTLVS